MVADKKVVEDEERNTAFERSDIKEVAVLQFYAKVCGMSEDDFATFCQCIKEKWGGNIYAINFIEMVRQRRHKVALCSKS